MNDDSVYEDKKKMVKIINSIDNLTSERQLEKASRMLDNIGFDHGSYVLLETLADSKQLSLKFLDYHFQQSVLKASEIANSHDKWGENCATSYLLKVWNYDLYKYLDKHGTNLLWKDQNGIPAAFFLLDISNLNTFYANDGADSIINWIDRQHKFITSISERDNAHEIFTSENWLSVSFRDYMISKADDIQNNYHLLKISSKFPEMKILSRIKDLCNYLTSEIDRTILSHNIYTDVINKKSNNKNKKII